MDFEFLITLPAITAQSGCKKRRQGNTDDMNITVIRSAKPSRIQIGPLTEELLTVDIKEASTSCSREAVHSLL